MFLAGIFYIEKLKEKNRTNYDIAGREAEVAVAFS